MNIVGHVSRSMIVTDLPAWMIPSGATIKLEHDMFDVVTRVDNTLHSYMNTPSAICIILSIGRIHRVITYGQSKLDASFAVPSVFTIKDDV